MNPEPARKPRALSELDLIAIALFTVAGALMGIAFVIVYVGVNYLNLLGAQWNYLWE